MSNHASKPRHTWRFFRAGGFDQVRLESGADLAHLDQLDQKLWVALACPTRGLEFDTKTLDLIDTDHDGRIRVPEILAATRWAVGMLKDPDLLTRSPAALPLEAINDATPEGKQLLSSARQILVNLGRPEATTISIEDTTDTARIFAQTRFNGDGVILPETAEDPAIQSVITDAIACLGSKTDRSGKPGIDQATVDAFFAQAQAYVDWAAQAETNTAQILPLGPKTAEAAAAYTSLKTKIDDYFARCQVAAYDPRALTALNSQETQYVALAASSLSATATELATLPLARVEAGRPLPLDGGVNPAWAGAMTTLLKTAVNPVLGNHRAALTAEDWTALGAKLQPYLAWQAAKAGAAVEKLGLPRLRQILASPAKAAITALVAKDQALEPEATSIAHVDKLVRYTRDLYPLLNNFVAFRDFYRRKDKAVFQVGTLYLDQRSCDLCVRVDDAGRHANMAHLAYTYLAYCDLVRKATGEKMSIAAAFTAGDSDNLMVGRNGLFYDRKGQDWDATITKIIENPISIRQAFWAPYKRLARWIADMIAKRAAAADTAAQARLQIAAAEATAAAASGKAPPPPPPQQRVDVGVVAAMGVALGAITTAFGVFLTWLTAVPKVYLPLYFILVLLVISLPSVILAALKLRQRNLGPILDANGWAVNARAKLNIPFGASLTATAKLPPGSQRDLIDPFAEQRRWPAVVALIVVLVAGLWALWFFGVFERMLPDTLPKSSWLEARTPKPSPPKYPASAPATTHAAPEATATKP